MRDARKADDRPFASVRKAFFPYRDRARHLDTALPAFVRQPLCGHRHRMRRSAHPDAHFSPVPALAQQVQHPGTHGGVAAELAPRHSQTDAVVRIIDKANLFRGRLQCHQPLCSQRLSRLGYGRLSQKGHIAGGIQKRIGYGARHL